MATFKDCNGREYKLELKYGTINRIKDEADFDISDLVNNQKITYGEFATDYLKFVSVLYVALEPQIKEYGLNAEEFGTSLYGDAIEDAQNAFFQALLDFCPPRQRRMLQAMADKAEQAQQMQEMMLGRMTPEKLVELKMKMNSASDESDLREQLLLELLANGKPSVSES